MPKLRFPGFEGEWENTELRNLAVYGKDKTKVAKNHFVSTENIEQNFGGIIPFEDSETMVDGTEFSKGDILIANIRPYLKKIWQSDMDGACNADVLVLKPQEIDNVFFYFLVAQNKFIDYVMGGVKGSKMPRGDKTHILQYNTAVPSILEQRQIAKFLSLLSNRIAAQKELVETLKKYKRGLLYDIFHHRKRFISSPVSEWSEAKLCEICSYRRGSFPQPYGLSEWYDEENGMPFIQVADVNDNMTVNLDTNRHISELAKKHSIFIPKGTLIVTLQGTLGRVAITSYDSYIDRTLLIIQNLSNSVLKEFLMYAIYMKFAIEKQTADGSIIKTITKETLTDFVIQIPQIQEQQKIVNILNYCLYNGVKTLALRRNL